MSYPHDHTGRLPIDLFDYELPEELIAQQPPEDRSSSRMLVLGRETGEITHIRFRDLGNWLRAGDLLVLNDTRVFPARLVARRATGGQVELLLLEQRDEKTWRALARPARRLKLDETLTVLDQNDQLTEYRVTLREKQADGTVTIETGMQLDDLQRVGRVPLPHYITEHLEDPERYQTVYAREIGSVAAPTAGLHFTQGIIENLKEQGVDFAEVTLHVGPGTFQPVKVDDARQHVMHAERYRVSVETIEKLRRARASGNRVVAVGTTSCRTLEAIAGCLDAHEALEGETSLYITPGFDFQVVDGLLTNFHLPRSTLLVLVSAFAGREPVLRAYAEAVKHRYRFYSFGDAMLII